MNDKQQGMLREFLTALAAAAILYGFGNDAIWTQASGGFVALVMLAWGIAKNEGAEAWFSLVRKVLSSVSGVLVLTGTFAPDKAEAILGLAIGFLSMVWSVWGKGNTPTIPQPPALLLICFATLLLASCGNLPPVSVSTPWGSGSKDANGTISVDTPYASGSKNGMTGEVIIYPKAPIVISTK